MGSIKFFPFIIFSGVSLSFVFMCSANDLLKDLRDSVITKNPKLFIQTVNKFKKLKKLEANNLQANYLNKNNLCNTGLQESTLFVNYQLNGETLLTFLIKEVNFLKHTTFAERNMKKLDKKFLEFFINVLPCMQDFLNTKNQEGQLPLELALKIDNCDFSAELIKNGANISLVSNSLLDKKIECSSLIIKLIGDYIAYYIVFLRSLRKDNFFEKFHKFNLESLVDIYVSKCGLNNLEEKESLLDLVKVGKSKIFSLLNNRSNNFKKKYLPKAYYHARDIFMEQENEQQAFDVFAGKQESIQEKKLCEIDLNKLIWQCFCRISRNIRYAKINTDQIFLNNLVSKKNKKNFVDVRITCMES